MTAFFEWWADRPPWTRYGVALVFLAASAGMWFAVGRIWFFGWGVGFALLFLAGPSDSEKKGYHF